MNAREHIQAGLAAHARFHVTGDTSCIGCDNAWPCPDRERYEALLKILNDAEKTYTGPPHKHHREWASQYRLVPDPQESATPETPNA